jgi:hypothetical protein
MAWIFSINCVEDVPVFVYIPARHLRKIVARAEYFSGRGENHGADLAITSDFVERADQLLHQLE